MSSSTPNISPEGTSPLVQMNEVSKVDDTKKVTLSKEGFLRLPNGKHYRITVAMSNDPNIPLKLSDEELQKIAKKICKILNESGITFQDLSKTTLSNNKIKSDQIDPKATTPQEMELKEANKERFNKIRDQALKIYEKEKPKKEETTPTTTPPVNSLLENVTNNTNPTNKTSVDLHTNDIEDDDDDDEEGDLSETGSTHSEGLNDQPPLDDDFSVDEGENDGLETVDDDDDFSVDEGENDGLEPVDDDDDEDDEPVNKDVPPAPPPPAPPSENK